MVRKLQAGKARVTGPMDSWLALGGSILASLLVIGALSSGTTTTPPSVISSPAATQAPTISFQAPAASRADPKPSAHPQATIYMSDSQNAAQLREWKKQNAESMKILEKTTKEVPLQ